MKRPINRLIASDENREITMYLENDVKEDKITFLVHTVNKQDNEETLTNYSLESFIVFTQMADYFIKECSVNNSHLRKKIMQLPKMNVKRSFN